MIGFANLENSISWAPLSMAMSLMGNGALENSEGMQGHTLKKLCRDLKILKTQGSLNSQVTALIFDSRRVIPGSVFFAIEGFNQDGNAFLEEAIDRGAVAVVSNSPAPKWCPITYIQVENVRCSLADMARIFFEEPDERLTMIGVTGTNGKTTTTMLLQSLLADEPRTVGLLGTVRYDLGRRTLPAYRTTPESVEVYGMLAEMVRSGCHTGIMEVSSHGLDQNRVRGINFDIVAFLNLTQDHLDYHRNKSAYFEAKARLFDGSLGYSPKIAILNTDDEASILLKKQIPEAVKIITFGVCEMADFYAKDIDLGPRSSTFVCVCPMGEYRVNLPLPGLFNIQNALAALAIGYALGKPLSLLLERLKIFTGVSGRMECVNLGQSFHVFVDYAHTDDALSKALTTLKCITPGALHVVFGCGGNRDRLKRPKMLQAALNVADFVWATSDNPRKESIDDIFDDMQAGISDLSKVTFISDRRLAILEAFKKAQPGDCILIAGKGHEAYQEFADTILPFDDKLVAENELRLLLGIE